MNGINENGNLEQETGQKRVTGEDRLMEVRRERRHFEAAYARSYTCDAHPSERFSQSQTLRSMNLEYNEPGGKW